MFLWGNQRAPDPTRNPQDWAEGDYGRMTADEEMDLTPNWEEENKQLQKKKNADEFFKLAFGRSMEDVIQERVKERLRELTMDEQREHHDNVVLRQTVSDLWDEVENLKREVLTLQTNTAEQRIQEAINTAEGITNKKVREQISGKLRDVENEMFHVEFANRRIPPRPNPLRKNDNPTPF